MIVEFLWIRVSGFREEKSTTALCHKFTYKLSKHISVIGKKLTLVRWTKLKRSHLGIPTIFLHCIAWNYISSHKTLGFYFHEGKYRDMKWWKVCHFTPSPRSNSETTVLHSSCICLLKTTDTNLKFKAKKNSDFKTDFHEIVSCIFSHHGLPSMSSFQKGTKIFIIYEEFK